MDDNLPPSLVLPSPCPLGGQSNAPSTDTAVDVPRTIAPATPWDIASPVITLTDATVDLHFSLPNHVCTVSPSPSSKVTPPVKITDDPLPGNDMPDEILIETYGGGI